MHKKILGKTGDEVLAFCAELLLSKGSILAFNANEEYISRPRGIIPFTNEKLGKMRDDKKRVQK